MKRCCACGNEYPNTREHFIAFMPNRPRYKATADICWNCVRIYRRHWANVRASAITKDERERRRIRDEIIFGHVVTKWLREYDTVVYFVRRRKLIKIGFTKDLRERMWTLKSQTNKRPLILMGVIPGGYIKEHQIHRQFAHLRRYKEWFHAAPELTDWILQNARLV